MATENKSWKTFNYGELAVNTVGGAATGALAGTGIGIFSMAGISGGVNAGVTWASNKLNGESTSVKDAAVSFGTGAVSGLLGGKGALADPEVKAATNSLSKLSGMANMGATWTKSGLDIAEETIRTTTRKAFTSGTGRGILGSFITGFEDVDDIVSAVKDKSKNVYDKYNEIFN